MKFFDCNAFFRAACTSTTFFLLACRAPPCGDGPRRRDRALVCAIRTARRRAADGQHDAGRGHRGPRTLGCWTVLPNRDVSSSAGGVVRADEGSAFSGAGAFPDSHRFLLNEWSLGSLLIEMVEREADSAASLPVKRGIAWRRSTTCWRPTFRHDLCYLYRLLR